MILRFIFKTLGNLLLTLGVSSLTFTYVPIAYSEIAYQIKLLSEREPDEQVVRVDPVDDGPDYENIADFDVIDSDFGIVINKIDVNAPVVKNVSTAIRSDYSNALKSGVAHARGTSLPGEDGNMFLFAHSSLDFWQLGPYATVFNLLNKLEKGDYVVIYYKGNPYAYEVFESLIVNGFNTEPFDTEYDEPVLTMVTCSPPGSTLNRLIVKAKRV